MEATILRYYPVLLIDLAVGLIGFGIGCGWWKASGRELDSDAVSPIAKIFGGITLFGMFLVFVM
jgi:hypothetical protein